MFHRTDEHRIRFNLILFRFQNEIERMNPFSNCRSMNRYRSTLALLKNKNYFSPFLPEKSGELITHRYVFFIE